MIQLSREQIKVNHNRVDYFFRVDPKLQKYFRPSNHLFMKYNCDISGLPASILSIPFAANVMPLAWLTDATLYVDELDRSFYDCLAELKQAYQKMFPHFPLKGQIKVGQVSSYHYQPEHEAAVLFSGGLDALTTYIRHRDKKPFLITEYGWHEGECADSEVWTADREHAEAFARKEGLSNILVESNYGTFVYPQRIDRDFRRSLGDTWWHGLHHGLAIISAAVPAACLLQVKTIYIASSHTIGNTYSCASDPSTDNLIRYGAGDVFHDGYELSRQDKVKVVVDHYANTNEKTAVRVCYRNTENCCQCEKCVRTIMGIAAEGHDPNDYGFPVPDELSAFLKRFLKQEVKFFTNIQIERLWKPIQERMRENPDNVKDQDLLSWFPDYDFVAQRRKERFRYRVTQFFPIIRRKVRTGLQQIRETR